MGPTGHEDAELNSNSPILRIKVYMYIILLFTVYGSLKYPLSGKQNPLTPFFTSNGYINKGGVKMEKKSSSKMEEEKKTTATTELEEPISPAESHNLQTKSSDRMAALQNSATRMISREFAANLPNSLHC